MAAGLLALTVVSTLAIVRLNDSASVVNLDDPLPPQVLAHRARGILEAAGWRGGHERWGWRLDDYRNLISVAVRAVVRSDRWVPVSLDPSHWWALRPRRCSGP